MLQQFGVLNSPRAGVKVSSNRSLEVNDDPNERDMLREKLQAAEKELAKLRDEAPVFKYHSLVIGSKETVPFSQLRKSNFMSGNAHTP
jgi:hypothetical protein